MSAAEMFVIEGTLIDAANFNELRVRPNHQVLVSAAGVIEAILQVGGPVPEEIREAVEAARAEGRVRQLLPGQFLIPGFVDCHIHAPQFSYTGTGLDLPLMGSDGWLERYTFPAERRLNQDRAVAERRYRDVVTETLRRGTTTALYFATLHLEPTKLLARVADELGQRAFIGKVAMDRNSPDDYQLSAKQNVEETEELFQYIEENCSSRVQAVITPRFVPTCSLELLKQLGDLAARRPGSRVQTHVAESHDELEFCRAIHPEQPRDVLLLDAAGLLPGPGRAVLAHGVHLSDSELDLVASRGAAVAYCPLSNAYFSDGVFRVREAVQRGVRVGLGTDVAGGYDPSMLSALRAAVWSSKMLQSGVSHYDFGGAGDCTNGKGRPLWQQKAALSHVEAFWLASVGGAQALGLEDLIGNFEVGKALDALVVDPLVHDSPLRHYPEDTLDDLFQKFLHLGDDRNIIDVYVQGQLASSRPMTGPRQEEDTS